jgi:putative membrane protein (TIGR04086 family)
MPNNRTEKAGNQHHKNKGNGYAFPLLICFLAGFLTLALLLCVGALIVSSTDSKGVLMVISWGILLVSAGVVGLLCGKAFRQERAVMGLICGVLFCLFLAFGNLLFYHHPFTVMLFVKYAVVVLVTEAAAILAKPVKKSKRKH